MTQDRSIRRLLYRVYWAMERRIAPTLKYSQYLYEDVLNRYVNRDVHWLDLGCGHQVLPTWRLREEERLVAGCGSVIGADVDIASLKNHRTIKNQVACDISLLPFRSNSFDLVTANMVVEHLCDPQRQFQEVSRVLKPGGFFLFHTPNRRSYKTLGARIVPEFLKRKLVYVLEGRKPEDVFLTFYRANTPQRIAEIAAASGFRVTNCKLLVSSAQFVVVPPLALLELLWIRLLMTSRFASVRPNIIAVLQKQTNAPVETESMVTTCCSDDQPGRGLENRD